MLHIVMIKTTVENGNTGKKRIDKEWHIGQPNPIAYDEVCNVSEVKADGDELRLIVEDFSGIPYNIRKKATRYFGDTARLIVGNI